MFVQLSTDGLIQLWRPNGARNQPLVNNSKSNVLSQLTPHTIVTTCHNQYEISAAFKHNPAVAKDMDPLYTTWRISRPVPRVPLLEKLRRHIDQPMNPLLIESI
jgi:hypothetical protein